MGRRLTQIELSCHSSLGWHKGPISLFPSFVFQHWLRLANRHRLPHTTISRLRAARSILDTHRIIDIVLDHLRES